MNSLALWNQIVGRAKAAEFEIHTVPLVKKQPLWFRVGTDGKTLLIKQAALHSPSSKLKMSRKISFPEFDCILGFYELRAKGVATSQEAIRKSVNTVYIYALIADARAYIA